MKIKDLSWEKIKGLNWSKFTFNIIQIWFSIFLYFAMKQVIYNDWDYRVLDSPRWWLSMVIICVAAGSIVKGIKNSFSIEVVKIEKNDDLT